MGLVEILAILSPLLACLFSALAWRRASKKDDSETAREMALLTSEVRHNKEDIATANANLGHNAEKILEKLERATEKLEQKIERNSEKLESKIQVEHCRIDCIERKGDKNEN